MAFTDIEVVKGYIRMCNDGWLQGWHERNGGNLTYRLRPEEVEQCRPYMNTLPGGWVKMGVQADNLRGEYFLATGSGKYFRNVIEAPQDNICLLEINDAGDSWRIVWGLEKGGRPTSEFPSHFMNHSVRKAATDGACRVIYHAHPANIIAMTYVVPGGAAIARATSELMKEFDAAVWAHHGLFCSGPDFDITFGLMHTIEKAAEIYVKAMSMGQGIKQTISDDNLRAIAKDFGVTLREEFLD